MTRARDFIEAFDKVMAEGGLRPPAPRGRVQLKRTVALDDKSVAQALALGDGNVSLGIRRALAQASARSSRGTRGAGP